MGRTANYYLKAKYQTAKSIKIGIIDILHNSRDDSNCKSTYNTNLAVQYVYKRLFSRSKHNPMFSLENSITL